MAHIRKIADGKYLIRVSKGSLKSRIFNNKTFRGTRKDAAKFARELETQIDQGLRNESLFRFEEYFKLWQRAVTPTVAPRTIEGYTDYINRYAVPSLRDLRINDIRGLHIQAIYAGLSHLSPTTIRNLNAALRACFGYAVRKEYLAANPCKYVDLPKKKRTREIVVLDLDEAPAFTHLCRQMPNGLLFEFYLETGLRPAEGLGIRWSDVTLKAGAAEIFVQQSVQFTRSGGGGYYFKDIKTKKGRRRIPLSETLRLALIDHRRKQNEHRLAMKGTWFDHGLIFPNEIGRPFEETNLIRRSLRPILAKMWPAIDDVPDPAAKNITLYSLRHSCATILLMLGENPKVVSDRLGHASVVQTLDTYSHVLPHIQEAATDKMERALRGIK